MSDGGIDRSALAELKARIDLADLIGRDIALKRRGREWGGLSPFSGEKTPSFTVAPAKGFWHCFSTGLHGDAIGWMIEGRGLRFTDAVRELASLYGFPLDALGLDSQAGRPVQADRQRERRPARSRAEDDARRTRFKVTQAIKIWREASLAEGTAVEAYLRSRGITIAVPPSLRFARLKHPDTEAELWPCIVAVMQNGAGRVTGVHRTFLDRHEPAKAPVTPNRLMLGPSRGACIRLCPAAEHLGLAEGIETALSVMQACGMPVWAVMSRGNFEAFDPPAECQRVTNLADNDTKDWRRARTVMRRAAQAQSERGLFVETAWPPRKSDFNDLLIGRV